MSDYAIRKRHPIITIITPSRTTQHNTYKNRNTMATPVTTTKWAGQYDCSTCHRKRLMATEFSRKRLDKFRQNPSMLLKCQSCVQEQQQQERAASSRVSTTLVETNEMTRTCAACQADRPSRAYNRNQWNKKDSRCRSCVELAEATAAQQLLQSKETKFQQAQKTLQEARVSGDSKRMVQAESVLAALEAERITGLKPTRVRRGSGGRKRQQY